MSKIEDKTALLKIGKRVKELRLNKGLSQFELNIDSDLSKNQLGRIERGENNFSVVTLLKIAKALDVSIKDFFD